MNAKQVGDATRGSVRYFRFFFFFHQLCDPALLRVGRIFFFNAAVNVMKQDEGPFVLSHTLTNTLKFFFHVRAPYDRLEVDAWENYF